MREVIKFLETNGFKQEDIHNRYSNDKCTVIILELRYCLTFKLDVDMTNICSNDLNIYWLIGILTYYGLINKEYKL